MYSPRAIDRSHSERVLMGIFNTPPSKLLLSRSGLFPSQRSWEWASYDCSRCRASWWFTYSPLQKAIIIPSWLMWARSGKKDTGIKSCVTLFQMHFSTDHVHGHSSRSWWYLSASLRGAVMMIVNSCFLLIPAISPNHSITCSCLKKTNVLQIN